MENIPTNNQDEIDNPEAVVDDQDQKESLEQPFDGEIIERLNDFCEDLENEQRREFADQPDMLSKLNVHFPTVWHISKMMDPDDEVLHLAARYHDYGRAPQFRSGHLFNDGKLGSDTDHHVIGAKAFDEDAPRILGDVVPDMAIADSQKSGVLQAVRAAILLHGMRGKAFAEEFAEIDEKYPRIADIVEKVSVIDDIANGTQCVNYLLREGQEQAKNASKGGFIPDENVGRRDVSPHVMELFREATSFNRNAECKTYPDYYLFGAFLAARNLKNPKTRALTIEAMKMPIMMVSHGEKDGEDVLISETFDDTMAAFKALFERELEPQDAEQAYQILDNYYKYGTPDAPEATE